MEKLQPEKVVNMLKSNGIEISREQAAKVLEFMRMLASSVVAQYLDRRNGPDTKKDSFLVNSRDHDIAGDLDENKNNSNKKVPRRKVGTAKKQGQGEWPIS